MTKEQYKAKYGDAVILGVDRAVVGDRLREGYTPNADAEGLKEAIEASLRPMLRCDAECDPSFKQAIPYVVLRHAGTGRVYITTRRGGDERLVGRQSIGLGGHVEAGEGLLDCLYRELNEEVGLTPAEIEGVTLQGYIYSSANEVSSVHVGMVYFAETAREDLVCLERDKLSGAWATLDEVRASCEADRLEDWSAIVCKNLLAAEANR